MPRPRDCHNGSQCNCGCRLDMRAFSLIIELTSQFYYDALGLPDTPHGLPHAECSKG